MVGAGGLEPPTYGLRVKEGFNRPCLASHNNLINRGAMPIALGKIALDLYRGLDRFLHVAETSQYCIADGLDHNPIALLDQRDEQVQASLDHH